MFERLNKLLVGGQVSAHVINRLIEEASRLSYITAQPPLSLERQATGIHINIDTTALGGSPRSLATSFLPGTISITASTFTYLSLNNQVDDGGWFTIAQPTRLTAPATSLFHVGSTIQWQGNTTGSFRHLWVQVNRLSGNVDGQLTLPPFLPGAPGILPPGSSVYMSVATVMSLHQGDFIEIGVSHDATSSLSLINARLWAYQIH